MRSAWSRATIAVITAWTLGFGTPAGAHDVVPAPGLPHYDPGAEADRLLRDLRKLDVHCSAAKWGAAIGGVMGGTIGAGVADDRPGRGAAAGALFGALLGGLVGQSIDAADQRCQPPKRRPPVRRYQI